MYYVSIKNPLGEVLDLTNSPAYSVTRVDGMAPVGANINVTDAALIDGGVYNSARLTTRNLVVQLAIEEPAEANRIALYRFCLPKRKHRVYIRNGARDVWIDGYVERVDVNYFDKKETAQISLICPDPFFRTADGTVVDFSSVTALFEFPFDIEAAGIPISEQTAESETVVVNPGESQTGVVITLRGLAGGVVTNPIIYNRTTGDTIQLNTQLVEGDVVTIDTRTGHKRVTLLREGTERNLLSLFDRHSSWLQLDTGDNVIYYTAESGGEFLECLMEFETLFEGM